MSAVKLNILTEPKKSATPVKPHRKVTISDADLKWCIRNHTMACHAMGKNYRCQVMTY